MRSAKFPGWLVLGILMAGFHGSTGRCEGNAPDFTAQVAALAEMSEKGHGAEAMTQFDALWATSVRDLAESHRKSADLVLARLNPFDARTAAALSGEIEASDTVTRGLAANVALLKQFKPAIYAAASASVSEKETYEADLYAALTRQMNLLMAAAVSLKGTPDAVDTSALFSRLQAAGAQPQDQCEAAVLKVIGESGPGWKGPAPLTAMAQTLAKTIGILETTTGDHATARAYLNAAVQLCPSVPELWAERSRALLLGGNATAAKRDLVVAFVMNAKSEIVLAVLNEFNSTQRLAGELYVEPVDGVKIAAVGMAFMAGQPPAGEGDQAAAAARRNYGRALYACSFITDANERSRALKWVEARYAKYGKYPCQSLRESAGSIEKEIEQADNDVGAVLAIYNKHAPVLAPEMPFWQMRCGALLALKQKAYLAAAIDVAATLEPDATWVNRARAALADLE